MKIIKANYEIMDELNGSEILKKIELCGRVCYKSEDKITAESAERFVRSLIKRGHDSVLEHFSFTVRFIVDRGVSHEIVRHRIGCSYSQESTRYCNYGGDVTFIAPYWFDAFFEEKFVGRKLTSEYLNSFDTELLCLPHELMWLQNCWDYKNSYKAMLEVGQTPQQARSVLPNSLKTEIVMTANLRAWRHFLKLRTDVAAHPQMREVTVPLLKELQQLIPVVFDDIIMSKKGGTE